MFYEMFHSLPRQLLRSLSLSIWKQFFKKLVISSFEANSDVASQNYTFFLILVYCDPSQKCISMEQHYYIQYFG